jgi:hypothetical protein
VILRSNDSKKENGDDRGQQCDALDAARYVLFGFAIICSIGALTARAAGRTGGRLSPELR